MTPDRTAEALDQELAAYAAQAERDLGAEQARSERLQRELDLAAQWNRQLKAELTQAQSDLRFMQRLPIDLPRFFERRPVRIVVGLVQRLRGRRSAA